MFQCCSYHVVAPSHIRIGSTPPTPCPGETQVAPQPCLSLNISITASLCRTPAVCTMWLVVAGAFSTLIHTKFVFWIFIPKKNISLLQANMKVHSQGCMEVVTQHMRENITTLVGLIVATLFIQVRQSIRRQKSKSISLSFFKGFFYIFSKRGGARE